MSGGLDAKRHLSHERFPFAPSCNALYRHSALKAAGGFDSRYSTYEGCDLHTRLLRLQRGPFRFERPAVVLHRHRATWRAYWKQQVRYGRGLGQFTWNYRKEIPWSVLRELGAWLQIAGTGLRACTFRAGDPGLLRRGLFVKNLAQRFGFLASYWNPRERRRW